MLYFVHYNISSLNHYTVVVQPIEPEVDD